MKHLLIIFSLLAFITPAHAKTTNLVCKLSGSTDFGAGMVDIFKNKIENISIKSRNGTPVSMSGFDEDECYLNPKDMLVCKDKLPCCNGGGYFDRIYIIDPNSGEILHSSKHYKKNTLVGKTTSGGFCKKGRQKKLF